MNAKVLIRYRGRTEHFSDILADSEFRLFKGNGHVRSRCTCWSLSWQNSAEIDALVSNDALSSKNRRAIAFRAIATQTRALRDCVSRFALVT